MLVPAAPATEFRGGSATKQGRTHQPHDLAQPFLLAASAPCELGSEVFRPPQGIEGLLEGLGSLLGVALVACEALVRWAATALAGFGVAFLIGFGPRHDVLRPLLGPRSILAGWIMDFDAGLEPVGDLLRRRGRVA
jgi:hypothetical protein